MTSYDVMKKPTSAELCTVLSTIPWAGPLSLIDFHSIDNDILTKYESIHSSYISENLKLKKQKYNVLYISEIKTNSFIAFAPQATKLTLCSRSVQKLSEGTFPGMFTLILRSTFFVSYF